MSASGKEPGETSKSVYKDVIWLSQCYLHVLGFDTVLFSASVIFKFNSRLTAYVISLVRCAVRV